MRVPAIYAERDYVEVGGLMSYRASLTDAYRQVARLCRPRPQGRQASDLPVVQATSSNWSSTPRPPGCFGLDVPATLLATADEVIE
jgi:putative ABC transport system substrate-binding protein